MRNRNVSGIVSGGPALDLVALLERYVFQMPLDEGERVIFGEIDLKSYALAAVSICPDTALHKVLRELAYTFFYIYLYDDIDWADSHSDFARYAIDMFGHMSRPVPREFFNKSEAGILRAREKYRSEFISGLEHFVDSAFAYLWGRKLLLQNFNERLAETITPLLKSDHPVLAKDGQLPRATYFPVWLKDMVMYRDRGLCCYCACVVAMPAIPNQTYDFDHVVPIALGGTNDPTNFVLSCSKCNNGKRTKSISVPDTFYWPQRAS